MTHILHFKRSSSSSEDRYTWPAWVLDATVAGRVLIRHKSRSCRLFEDCRSSDRAALACVDCDCLAACEEYDVNALYCDNACRNSAALMLPGVSGLGILS